MFHCPAPCWSIPWDNGYNLPLGLCCGKPCRSLSVWKRWKVVKRSFVVSCYTLVYEKFYEKKERNANMWHQSSRHGMVNNQTNYLAPGLKWNPCTHWFCNHILLQFTIWSTSLSSDKEVKTWEGHNVGKTSLKVTKLCIHELIIRSSVANFLINCDHR